MQKTFFSVLVVFSSIGLAQQSPNTVVAPDNWKCVDKTTPEGQKYQICSPPAGQQGNPFFVWTRQPKSK